MRFDLFWYGSIDICGSSIYMYAVCFIFVPGGGGGGIWNRRGCSSEILGDYLGVAQAFCDP